MADLKTVSESLRTLKQSVDQILKTRLDKIEASFERSLTDLSNRLSQVAQDQRLSKSDAAAIGQKCEQHTEAVEMRAETRMAALETRLAALERKVNGPRQEVTKLIERDANGLIKRIVPEK